MGRKAAAKAAELEEDALIVEYLRQRQLKEQVHVNTQYCWHANCQNRQHRSTRCCWHADCQDRQASNTSMPAVKTGDMSTQGTLGTLAVKAGHIRSCSGQHAPFHILARRKAALQVHGMKVFLSQQQTLTTFRSFETSICCTQIRFSRHKC